MVTGAASEIRVGIIGAGTVGSGILRLLRDNARTVEQRLGAPIVVKRVAARDSKKKRESIFPEANLVFDPMSVISDPEIDIVVEVMGGIDPAYSLVRRAIDAARTTENL